MKKTIRSKTAVTLLTSIVMLLLWLVCMLGQTVATARYVQDIRNREHYSYTNQFNFEDWFDPSTGEPTDYWKYESFKSGNDCGHYNSFPDTCQTASILTDLQGNVLLENGTWFFCNYHTAESWEAGADLERDGTARILFSMDLLPEETGETLRHDLNLKYFVLRFTGVMDGNTMQAHQIEYIDHDEFWNRDDFRYAGQYSFVISQEVARFDLPWHPLYEDPSAAGEDMVTIYTTSPRLSVYEAGSSFRLYGENYGSLMDFLKQKRNDASLGDGGMLHAADRLIHELDVRKVPIFENGTYTDENTPVIGYLYTAIRYSPLMTAMVSMVDVYAWTFSGLLILILVVCRILILNLVIPMKSVNEAADQDWKYLIYHNDHGAVWKEAVELEKHYNEARNHRMKSKDEIFRLQAALDYAKTAEENRRRMTSAIAHEWKTPLAVIHSYAEGLKEHIAEDKRDHYLDVILSETETLDAMVLELLDLSRLEAGKVKLTRDEFSLSSLAQGIHEKLRRKAQEKALTMEVTLSGDCIVTADEGRIAQVITNFLSNAIRYTPQGGSVSVKVFDDRLFAWFRVENDSQPFTEEELAKLWETFYRTDKARSGEGTGLGLAICKSIIDLHGGLCKAENTETGVAFWFRLKKS